MQGINVDVKVPQIMRCVLCHPTSSTPTVFEGQSSTVSQPTTRSKKGILNYNFTHGSVSMMKHVMKEHVVDMERYKEVVAAIDAEGKKHKCNKRKQVNPSAITEYYGSTSPYGKNDVAQQRFLEDLVLYIAK